MTGFKNKTILQILDKYKDLWALSYVSGVSHWDLETYMPQAGASVRGEALGRVNVIQQKLFLSKDFVDLIHKAQSLKNLTDEESGVVRKLARDLKYYEKLPSKFIEEYENLTNIGTLAWRKAKETENYKLFEPYLAKIFDMNKKAANYLGFQDSPYDALLDQYEEGLTVDRVEPFFAQIKQPLYDLLTRIEKSPNYFEKHKLEKAKYNEDKLKTINLKILEFIWADFSRLRLDISRHPFTTSFSRYDTRITTWYHKTDFARSILATVHELGHALYDLQSSDKIEKTPIAGGSSLVLHESQSRFWENHVARSEPFIKKFKKDFETAIGYPLSDNDLLMYFNQVKPSLLRVEADEITYHFHIMLRYEIEKGLIEGKLKIKDVREIWNSKMKEYLGIKPRYDSEGILQDIHWGQGTVGYFPTYSLGTFLSAQWAERINNSQFKINNLEQTKKWLQEHVHKYGSTYTLSDLLKKNKMAFDPLVNLKYLEEKYSKIYGFASPLS